MKSDLTLRGVHKRYGKTVALDGLDLSVPRGSLTGFIGPNGAGKTTAFAIATGGVKADAGSVEVLGAGPFDPRVHAGRVGCLPQDAELPAHSIVRELLVHWARLGGATRREAERDTDRVLSEVSLRDRAGARVGSLSHGMRRRLAVAQALLGEPELVLLDEPTSGLDPELVVQMRELLRAQRGRRTLVVSSHVLADLDAICDHAVFVEAGRVVRAGAVTDLTDRERTVRVVLDGVPPIDAVAAAFPEAMLRAEASTLVARVPDGLDAAALNARLLPLLLAEGARVLEVRLGRTLEDAYLARPRSRPVPEPAPEPVPAP